MALYIDLFKAGKLVYFGVIDNLENLLWLFSSRLTNSCIYHAVGDLENLLGLFRGI